MNRKNPAKESFLKSIPSITIESAQDRFLFTAFSFQFFDSSQDAGQNFSDWTHEQLCKLLDKLKAYCQNTIEHWCRMPVGHGVSHVLEIYVRAIAVRLDGGGFGPCRALGLIATGSELTDDHGAAEPFQRHAAVDHHDGFVRGHGRCS